jgi:hypothetical protein
VGCVEKCRAGGNIAVDVPLEHDQVLQTFLTAFDVARLLKEFQDGETLAAWVAIPLAVLGYVEAALVIDVGEVAGALPQVSASTGDELVSNSEIAGGRCLIVEGKGLVWKGMGLRQGWVLSKSGRWRCEWKTQARNPFKSAHVCRCKFGGELKNNPIYPLKSTLYRPL